MLERLQNKVFASLLRRRLAVALASGGTALVIGLAAGLLAELLFVGGFVAWALWERRARFLLGWGLHEAAERISARKAARLGPSVRRDYHLLTCAAARLSMGNLAGSKRILTELDPERAPPEERFCQLLNLAELFRRLGDVDTALVMVEAAAAEVPRVPRRWRAFPSIVEARALVQRGDFGPARRVLEALPRETLPAGSWRGLLSSTLALTRALEGGDPATALRLAREGTRLRPWDHQCRGILGVTTLLAGAEPGRALIHLEAAAEKLGGCGPMVAAAVLSGAARCYREAGLERQAREVEERLEATPGAAACLGVLRRALTGREEVLLLPPGTGESGLESP